MSLTVPFINTIPAIDVTQDNLKTSVNILGGSAITGYRVYLYNNYSDTPIYTSEDISVSNDIESYSIRSYPIDISNVILTSYGMVNNSTYLIRVETFNATESMTSNQQIIICYKRPSIALQIQNTNNEWVDLTDNTTLSFAKGTFNIHYTNNDNNSVAQPNVANITLYGIKFNGQKVLINKVENIYKFTFNQSNYVYDKNVEIGTFEINVDNNGNHLTESNTQYYSYEIELTLSTIENMTIKATYSQINCYYNESLNSSYLKVYNLCKEGKIQIDFSINSINGTAEQTPIFINNDEVDLTDNSVNWQDILLSTNAYTIRIWGRDFNTNSVIFRAESSTMTNNFLEIKYNKINIDNVDYDFISLECGWTNTTPEYTYSYYIESDKILSSTITSATNLFIGIQQQNNMFDISFQILS